MASSVTIASQALVLLGANSINSFEDDIEEAVIAKEFYDDFITSIFSKTPWSFATKKKQLTKSATAPLNEFKYQYSKVTEALYYWAFYDSSAVGVYPITDYDIQKSYILANTDPLYAEYAFYADESLWPPAFVQYAIHAFAELIAIPVTDDPDLMASFGRKAHGAPSEGGRGGLFMEAAGADARQKPPQQVRRNRFITSRFR